MSSSPNSSSSSGSYSPSPVKNPEGKGCWRVVSRDSPVRGSRLVLERVKPEEKMSFKFEAPDHVSLSEDSDSKIH